MVSKIRYHTKLPAGIAASRTKLTKKLISNDVTRITDANDNDATIKNNEACVQRLDYDEADQRVKNVYDLAEDQIDIHLLDDAPYGYGTDAATTPSSLDMSVHNTSMPPPSHIVHQKNVTSRQHPHPPWSRRSSPTMVPPTKVQLNLKSGRLIEVILLRILRGSLHLGNEKATNDHLTATTMVTPNKVSTEKKYILRKFE